MGKGQKKHQKFILKRKVCHVKYIHSAKTCKKMLQIAFSRPVSHISLDLLYSFNRETISNMKIAGDIRSIQPIFLAIVIVEHPINQKPIYHRFIADLRKKKIRRSIRSLLGLPICFVGHDLKPILFYLSKQNIPAPRTVWDTYIYAKASIIGRHHQKRPDENSEYNYNLECSLKIQCFKTGISFSDDSNIKESITHTDRLTNEQKHDLVQDANRIAQLYPFQVREAANLGILNHIINIEMPFVKTIARMEWNGIGYDRNLADEIINRCDKAKEKLKPIFSKHGLSVPPTDPELYQFFYKKGLLPLFNQKEGCYSFERAFLKQHIKRHKSISYFIKAGRLDDIEKKYLNKWNFLVGIDNRIHPEYHQIAVSSARVASRGANIIAWPGYLRPVVVASKGKLIAECDWSQNELGIAGAIYKDHNLINLYNKGDLFIAVAKEFYREHLSKESLELSDKKFREKYPKYRDQMKTCTLAIINGMTQYGLAQELNCSISEAENLMLWFEKKFPQLHKNMRAAKQIFLERGYSSTITNLHRYRSEKGTQDNRGEIGLLSHTIQGSVAAIFKMTGNRLDQLYRQYDAALLIPMHDAYVFEAPKDQIKTVVKLTKRLMIQAVQEFFPELRPKVKTTIWGCRWGNIKDLNEVIK